MKKKKNKKKSKKKIIIGAAVILVAAGGIRVVGQKNAAENQTPQVPVVTAETGDVEEIVDASGIVGSEEEKTYYSPVNAELKTVSFSQGDVVKKGTKLIEFETENLEKDNQRAELNLKSTRSDIKDTVNKSEKADKKQKDAKADVAELEKKVKDKKAYVASLKSQISAAQAAAQRAAAAQASAQAAAQAQAQQQAAQEKAQAEAKKQQEIQSRYEAAIYTYQTETLPQYQQQLDDLNAQYNQAETAYNQADTAYQMAFSAWQTDNSEENTQALNEADSARSQAEIAKEQAREAYEDLKQQVPQMPENLIVKVVSEIHDPVTTTDELIPSGETSSYRSNPLGLAEFTLSRKDPAYVGRAKEVQKAQEAIQEGKCPVDALPEMKPVMDVIKKSYPDVSKENLGVGSTIFAVKPGDGSAREQAASCQKVLGGWANIANEYATKRYRSNLINWGMLPFLIKEGELPFANGDYLFFPEIRKAVAEKDDVIKGYVVGESELKEFEVALGELTDDEREIILKGCLINYNRK